MIRTTYRAEIDQRIAKIVSRIIVDAQIASSEIGSGEFLTDKLLADQKLSESQVSGILEEVTGTRYINPKLISFSQKFLRHAGEFLPRKFLLKHKVLPIKHKDLDFHVVMHNPLDKDLINHLEVVTGSNIIAYCSSERNIIEVIDQHYPDKTLYQTDSWNSVLEQALKTAYSYNHQARQKIDELLNEPSIIHLLRLIFLEVADADISDIHFEPQNSDLRIRVRQDGVLRIAWTLPGVLYAALINRIKLLAGLSAEDCSKPQDGRIAQNLIKGRMVDMRVSSLPGIFGEKIVIRLLDKGKSRITLEEMNLEQSSMTKIANAMKLPNGMILLTGPTGSGKTTTLYAILDKLNHVGVNISTAEDPVEYDLAGITQVDCSKKQGATFSEALKSFMRQDPDIIMIGEIRDLETADIASKAALTGHLLLSTLHTNDAPSAITRLMNIGVAPYILAACNITIVAQRLLRCVCGSCGEAAILTDEELVALNITEKDIPSRKIYRGTGCEICNQTGYKGRTAIAEVLVIDDKIEKAIINNSGVSEITRIATDSGMLTLHESALNRMWQGLVTPEEVLRVTAAH